MTVLVTAATKNGSTGAVRTWSAGIADALHETAAR